MSDLTERLRPLVKHLRQVWRNFPRMSDQIDAVEALDEAADEIERLHTDWRIQNDHIVKVNKEIERLRAVVDAVDYLYECWRESGDSVDWGNALPNLFEKRAALEDNNE